MVSKLTILPLFRLYNELVKLRHVWRLGSPLETSRYSIDLGETAVDFDFGAPRFVQDSSNLGGLLQTVSLDESQVSVCGR